MQFFISDATLAFETPLTLEQDAAAALASPIRTSAELSALAQLVDWEFATLGELGGLGKRCERALSQWVASSESLESATALAQTSDCIGQLVAARELQAALHRYTGSAKVAAIA